ncbi:MAG: hypothetical protein EPO32_12785 [Anaerolineae bacterium]|nr:MAG: hypothetical protein EPO32_12785 [Anaerolineae bacterium]
MTLDSLKHRTKSNLRIGLLLSVIVLGGAGLRLYGLDFQSFWSDEAGTYRNISMPTLAQMNDAISANGQAPLGFYFELAAYRFLGSSETALRFPPALAGILTIFAIYLLGRRLFGYQEGLLSAGMMAVLFVPIYYSQEARVYAWVLLFSIIATYYWFGCLKSLMKAAKLDRRQAVLYFVFALSALYTHYLVGLMLVWQAGVLVLVSIQKKKALETMGLYAAFVPGFALWLPRVFQQVGRERYLNWIIPPYPEKVLQFFSWALSGLRGRTSEPNFDLPLILGAAFVAYGIFSYLMKWGRDSETMGKPHSVEEPLLLLAIVVPMVILYAFSHAVKSLWVDRYIIFLIAPLYLLVARGALSLVMLVPGRFVPAARGALGAGLVIYLLFHTVFVKDYYEEVHKYQAREVARAIQVIHESFPNSYSVGCGYSTNYDYYEEQFGGVTLVDGRQCQPEDVDALAQLLADGGYEHLILSDIHLRVSRETREALEGRYCLLDVAEFYGGNVWLYDVKTSGTCK